MGIELVEHAERVRLFEKLLAELDEDKRTLLILSELEQWTLREIAELFGSNTNTILFASARSQTRLRSGVRPLEGWQGTAPMSKPPTEHDDWSPQAEALFHSARETHAPTEADRARVRGALSQKLAAAAGAPAAGGDAQPRLTDAGTGASRAALGNFVKAGLGLACVMAGAVRADASESNREKEAEAKSIATQAGAPGAKPAQHAARARGSGQRRGCRLRRSRRLHRPRSARKSRCPRVVAPRRSRPAVDGGEGFRSGGCVRASRREGDGPGTGRVSISSSRRRAPSRRPPRLRAGLGRGRTRTPTTPEDMAEARAELAFVERINAAVRMSKPRTVLALCAEHERRWPHGTFEQEREGLRAIASCNSKASGAAARAQTFLASYPHAPLAVRVRDECAAQLAAAAKE